MQAGCAFNISYMQRHLDLENTTERMEFAQWGHQARFAAYAVALTAGDLTM